MSKASKIVSKAGTAILCLVLVVAVVFLVFQIFASRGLPMPGGYRPLIVLSGSMEPAMPVGSVVVSRSVDPVSVKVGDIVTYAQTTDPTGKTSPFITHRVTEVIQGAGGISFVTKGDANNTQDLNPIPASQLVGRVVLIMPFVGDLTRFVRSPLGLILMILLPGAILIGWEVIGLVNRRKKPVKAGGRAAAILLLSIMGVSALAIATGPSVKGTEAYFVTASNPLEFRITTGTWEEPGATDLALSPGCSKAVREGSHPACFPIASLDASGKLALDFGEIKPGDSKDFPDVFRIENLGTQPAELNVVALGDFAGFVGSITLADDALPATLAAGEQRSVAIGLQVPKTTAPGDYTGTIQVTATDGSYSEDIPVTLTVKGCAVDTRLALTPGGSKAYDGNGHLSHAPIASLDAQGKLKLDFGDVMPPENGESSDVFRVKNLGTRPVQVNVAASGDFAGLIGRIRVVGERGLPVVIGPGRQERIAIKLDVARSAEPGIYQGTVRVWSTDGSFSEDIPVSLTVLEKGCGKEEPIVPTAPQLMLSPGESRAARFSEGDGEPTSFVIANVKGDALRLDFGDLEPGGTMKSADVFEVKNAGLEDVEVEIVALGEFKDFVKRIELGGHKPPQMLGAGDERSVAIDLDIPKDASAGEYSGKVRVSAANGSFSVDIPVVLRVVEKEKAPADKEDEIAPEDPPVDPDPAADDPPAPIDPDPADDENPPVDPDPADDENPPVDPDPADDENPPVDPDPADDQPAAEDQPPADEQQPDDAKPAEDQPDVHPAEEPETPDEPAVTPPEDGGDKGEGASSDSDSANGGVPPCASAAFEAPSGAAASAQAG